MSWIGGKKALRDEIIARFPLDYCLYNYEITKNTIEDEQFIIEGHFCKPNMMSDSLRRRLIQYGVPQNKLNRFLKGDDSE